MRTYIMQRVTRDYIRRNIHQITSRNIQIISTQNIDMFFSNHPELLCHRPKVNKKIRKYFSGFMTNGLRPIERGGMIRGRQYIIDILGDIAEDFFIEIAKSVDHMYILSQNAHDRECSLK